MLTAWLIIMMLCVLVNIMYAGEADRRYVMAGRRADDDVGKLMADETAPPPAAGAACGA